MTTGPPVTRPLDRACTSDNKEYLKWIGSYVGPMRPKTMITCQSSLCIDIDWAVSCSSPAVIPLTLGLVLTTKRESFLRPTEHRKDIIKCGPNDRCDEDWHMKQAVEGQGRGDHQDGEIEPPDASDGRKALCKVFDGTDTEHGLQE